jgi:pimeloyl-ACP methyl ester carboxylesterase
MVFAQEKFFDSKGVQIHYMDQGKGDPIVLVHGSGGSIQSWTNWRVFENLVRDHRVIALDCRGHGRSGKPHDPRMYGREMAWDIARLLDHLGIATAHVIGTSMGANLTALLLTLAPDRFLTATLTGHAGRLWWTAEDQQRAELEAFEFERDGLSRSQSRRLAPSDEPPETDDAFRQRAAAVLKNPNADRYAIAAFFRSEGDQVVTPSQVANVMVPTLAIVGSADPNIKEFQYLKQLRPGVELIIVNGATHGGDRGVTRRPEFVTAVREFMAMHSTR